MTLQEYEAILTDLILRKRITLEQARELRERFVAGDFGDDDLPLPLAQAKERNDDEWILLFLFAALSQHPSLGRREEMQLENMRRFDSYSTDASTGLAGGGTIRQWHEEMNQIVVGGMLGNWLAGNGTIGARPNIDEQINEQLEYLYRFAADNHAASQLGTLSQDGIISRVLLYGGAIWASWFRGNESAAGRAQFVRYVAVDDRGTCTPCRRAQGIYPVNAGPYPGDVCLGGGRCRCRRELIEL